MSSLFPRAHHEPRQLRDYQADAIDLLRDSLRSGHRRPVLQAPTAFGKTVVASNIVKMAREKHKRVVFCVPAIDLIDQTLESFGTDGVEDIGVIQRDHIETDWARPVQIASVQTLMRRTYPAADLVIIDECHRWFDFYGTWMNDPAWAKVPFIGLSATPWTKGLGKFFDHLIITATTEQLIERGYLSKFRVFAPSHPDLSGVRTQRGDYHEGDLSKAMDKAPLVADVVETWIKRGEGRPTLVYGVDCAHAQHLQERFQAAGINAGYQDSRTPKDERAEIRRLFHSGHYEVVCNVGTLTTGVDWDVRCIVLARPTKSEMLYTQIIGRGLRTADGKDDCLILDHSDTTLRLGLVTDIHHDELDDGRERQKQEAKKETLPKDCPKCAYLKPPRTSECPNCGFKPVATSKIEVKDGELEELTKTQRKRHNSKMIELRGREIPLGDFFGQLKTYGAEKGYKPGWASAKFRDAVGVWPNAYKSAPSLPVCFEVDSWVRAQAIKWAKSRRNKEASHAHAAD